MVLIRLFVIVMVVSTIFYVSISLYSRARRKEKLIEQWRADLRVGDRDGWLREEMDKYDTSLRRRLILLVYIVPFAFIGLMVYFQNFA